MMTNKHRLTTLTIELLQFSRSKKMAGRTTPLEVSSGSKRRRRRQPTLKTPNRAEWREGLTGETVAVACMVAKWAFLMPFSEKIVFFGISLLAKMP